jgi:hypothetical protein
MLQGHLGLVPDRVQDFEARDIPEGIDSAMSEPPILFGQTWDKKERAIPVP